uniref:C2 domain-containing protein n=1 Tax=Tetraselmis chuii TaxID=63592 RepID=A0A7S1T598_9CHLO
MVEGRRRVVVPLEVEPARDGEAVDGDILIRVLSCSGLPSGSELNRFQVTARNANLQVARRSRIKSSLTGAPVWNEQRFVLRTGDRVGMFFLDVEELSSKTLIGTAVVNAAALDDGCTAFWAAGRDGGPLARRWTPRQAAWRVTVPLENAAGQVIPNGDIALELSTVRWLFKQARPPLSTNFSSPGPRSIVLRVLEAHNVGSTRAGTRLVQVKYNNQTEETQLVANSNHPVWNRTFVFPENPSVATRKMRLKVLSARSMAGLERELGFTYINLDSIFEGEQYDSWIELGGTPRGRLHVVADIIPGLPNSEAVRRFAATQWVPAYSPSLKVEIVEARDLAASDLDGSSDPYCFITYGSASTQTQVVPKDLNPNFAHKAIMPLRKREDKLRLSCMDYDFLRSDDPLGSAEVDVGSLLSEAGKEVEVWVRLHGARPDMFSSEGEVLLRLSRMGSFDDVVEGGGQESEGEEAFDVLADSYYMD